MTPVEDSATPRAEPLTEKLPFIWPVDEFISNKPVLADPASIHIRPSGCGSAAAIRLLGARRMRCGSILTAAAPFACGETLAEQAAMASTAAVSPITRSEERRVRKE